MLTSSGRNHFGNLLSSFPGQTRAEKGYLVKCLYTLPHIPAVFMTSLIQTAGQKMAALKVMFCKSSNVDF